MKDHQAMHHIVRKDYGEHLQMEHEINLQVG